jgi:minor histocompatibility antigen H13
MFLKTIRLNKLLPGVLLLTLLFFYDIFWVFYSTKFTKGGESVMVAVATGFEAPIKENGVFGSKFAMLGLGDIVIPGIFIALLLRFDLSLKRDSKTYFYTCFLAYFLGLVTTILVMVVFQHAQPALLYLVPFCIGFPVIMALIKGDLKAMFDYTDEEEKPEGVKDEGEKKDE